MEMTMIRVLAANAARGSVAAAIGIRRSNASRCGTLRCPALPGTDISSGNSWIIGSTEASIDDSFSVIVRDAA